MRELGRYVGIAAAIAVAVAIGCGATTSGAEGISCTEQADCQNGLQCLPFMVIADGGCSSIGNECLEACQSDEDCANLDAGFVCLKSCGGTSVCEPPMTPLEAGVEAAAEAGAAEASAPSDAGGQ